MCSMGYLKFKLNKLPLFALLAAASLVVNADTGTFTLYRNSVLDPSMRLHVATFDAADGRAYNAENCNTAADLFSRQPGVRTRFWCEAGRFKK